MKISVVILMGLLICSSTFATSHELGKAEFLRGGDISMLLKFEELNAVFRNADGKPENLIKIMTDHGCNFFRVRIFVNPTMNNAVIQDLPYVVELAKRIKKSGAKWLLDFHYSDTWADPSHQIKPSAWGELSFPELERKVEAYTAHVITTLKENTALPDMVQIGNEITPGMIYPDGKLYGSGAGGWDQFAVLLKAGIRGVKKPLSHNQEVQIMIHIAEHNPMKAHGLYKKLMELEVEYDVIGLSYYPNWHGNIENLKRLITQTGVKLNKEVIVVETAYYAREKHNTKGTTKNNLWPMTPEGQKQFLEDIVMVIKSTPNDLGAGVLWWYPESIPVKGINVWNGGKTALFDRKGHPRPALSVFK